MLKITFAAVVIAATAVVALATVDQRRHGSTAYPAPNVICDEVWYPDNSMENICFELNANGFHSVIVTDAGVVIREPGGFQP